jgi:acetyltransferase-like isoleucine patch superfamily enzyme
MLEGVRRILSAYRFQHLVVRLAEEYLWWILRSLPGFEGVFLRYLFLKCTARELKGFCWISQGCTIVNSFGLRIGRNFATNRNVLIDALGGIEIGDDTGIGPNCVLISQEHSMLRAGDYFSEGASKRRPITIGSGVWIGSNCFIKAGVTIGDAAVIAACTNVVADVAPKARVIGSPARSYIAAAREILSPGWVAESDRRRDSTSPAPTSTGVGRTAVGVDPDRLTPVAESPPPSPHRRDGGS